MISNCPFFPNEPNPCSFHNCQFQCAGGCAISLAAYAHDAFTKTEKIDEKIDYLDSKLKNIEYEIKCLKQ